VRSGETASEEEALTALQAGLDAAAAASKVAGKRSPDPMARRLLLLHWAALGLAHSDHDLVVFFEGTGILFPETVMRPRPRIERRLTPVTEARRPSRRATARARIES
jgi:hypothetical protein